MKKKKKNDSEWIFNLLYFKNIFDFYFNNFFLFCFVITFINDFIKLERSFRVIPMKLKIKWICITITYYVFWCVLKTRLGSSLAKIQSSVI